mmetsp:Transcript_94710/g.294583  ORF Transcript_94710/g.294583 Transcript_94710/m.294583 type:complete len:507 (-) Transcript_94710:2-1522(-)
MVSNGRLERRELRALLDSRPGHGRREPAKLAQDVMRILARRELAHHPDSHWGVQPAEHIQGGRVASEAPPLEEDRLLGRVWLHRCSGVRRRSLVRGRRRLTAALASDHGVREGSELGADVARVSPRVKLLQHLAAGVVRQRLQEGHGTGVEVPAHHEVGHRRVRGARGRRLHLGGCNNGGAAVGRGRRVRPQERRLREVPLSLWSPCEDALGKHPQPAGHVPRARHRIELLDDDGPHLLRKALEELGRRGVQTPVGCKGLHDPLHLPARGDRPGEGAELAVHVHHIALGVELLDHRALDSRGQLAQQAQGRVLEAPLGRELAEPQGQGLEVAPLGRARARGREPRLDRARKAPHLPDDVVSVLLWIELLHEDARNLLRQPDQPRHGGAVKRPAQGECLQLWGHFAGAGLLADDGPGKGIHLAGNIVRVVAWCELGDDGELDGVVEGMQVLNCRRVQLPAGGKLCHCIVISAATPQAVRGWLRQHGRCTGRALGRGGGAPGRMGPLP